MSQRSVRNGQRTTTPIISREGPLPRLVSDEDQRSFSQYTVIDLFSGAGGMTCGFWEMGFTIKGAIDKQVGKPDELTPCNKTYQLNFGIAPDDIDMNDDQGQGKPSRYRSKLKLRRGELTVLISCPPCTGYSQKNYLNHTNDDPRNALVTKTAGFVDEFRPEFLVMENVPEMFKGNNRHHFSALYRQLRAMGYSVFVKIFDFADFGLPQHRKRVIVLARKNNGNAPNLTGRMRTGRHTTIKRALRRHKLPPLHNGEKSDGDPVHVCPRIGGRGGHVLERCKLIRRAGGRWTGLKGKTLSDLEASYLTSRIMSALGQGDTKTYPDCYGTVHANEPSKTIIRQCGDVGTGAWFHWSQDRMLSAREMAILQGFPYKPDSSGKHPFYRFAGSPGKIYQQIGNAVPPLVSRIIAQEILKILTGHSDGLHPDQFPDPTDYVGQEPATTAPMQAQAQATT